MTQVPETPTPGAAPRSLCNNPPGFTPRMWYRLARRRPHSVRPGRWPLPGTHPDVVEGIGFVVCIVDEAVSPVVPLWQRDPQPGVHVLQKLAPVLDGLQGQCPSQQGGLAVCRRRPPTGRGAPVSVWPHVGPGRMGASQGQGRPHAPMGVTGVPPLERLDHQSPPLLP